jgi:hypothetical protein
MIQRNPAMDCLLCQINKATETGSHLIPASIIASMIGARDKEEGYGIHPQHENPFSSFFGRSNLKNENIEQQENDFIVDYFFCPSCEKRFSILENEINPVLTKKIFDPNQKQNFPHQELDSGLQFLICKKVNPCIFRLYLFSLIYRWCLKYRFVTGGDFLATPSEVNWFRKILNVSLGNTLGETLENCSNPEIETVSFIICTCPEDYNKSANMVLLHPHYRFPYCFIVNEYIILFSFTKPQLNSSELIELTDFRIDARLINTSGEVKIALSNHYYWNKFMQTIWEANAEVFKSKYIMQLSAISGVHPNKVADLLDNKAKEIQMLTGKIYSYCYLDAFNFYCNQ